MSAALFHDCIMAMAPDLRSQVSPMGWVYVWVPFIQRSGIRVPEETILRVLAKAQGRKARYYAMKRLVHIVRYLVSRSQREAGVLP